MKNLLPYPRQVMLGLDLIAAGVFTAMAALSWPGATGWIWVYYLGMIEIVSGLWLYAT